MRIVDGYLTISKSDAIEALACSTLAASKPVRVEGGSVPGWNPTRGNCLHEFRAADGRKRKPVRSPKVDDATWSEAAEAYAEYAARHPITDEMRSRILSVEEDAVSASILGQRVYEPGEAPRANFWLPLDRVVGVNTNIAISGARDRIQIAPGWRRLQVVDTKSADYLTDDEKKIEAAFYILPTLYEHRGFEDYEFLHEFLAEGRTSSFGVFRPGDIEEVARFVLRVCEDVIDRLQNPKPTANRRCGGCHLRDTCPAYSTAIDTPPERRPVAALSMAQIEEEDERVQALEKIVGAYRDELKAEQKRRLEAGPVVEAGEEWYLGEKTTRYDRPADQVASLAVAALNAGKITQEQFGALLSVATNGVAALKSVAPELHAAIKALAVPRKAPVVKHRPAPVIESLPADEGKSAEAKQAAGRDTTTDAIPFSDPPEEPSPLPAGGEGASEPSPEAPAWGDSIDDEAGARAEAGTRVALARLESGDDLAVEQVVEIISTGGEARPEAPKRRRTRRACRVSGCENTGRHAHVFGVQIPGGFVAPDGAEGPWLRVAAGR